MRFTLSCLAFVTLLSAPCFSAPLLVDTYLTAQGALRPNNLVTRQINVINVNGSPLVTSDSADGPTGSSSTSAGLGSTSGASESSSNFTSSSSSTSCTFLGGCSASAATACPVDAENTTVTNSSTSSSNCGSGSSTNSASFLGNGVLRRSVVNLAAWL